MKKISIIGTALMLYGLYSFAQDESQSVNKSLLSMYIIPIKVTYELGIGSKTTLEFAAGISSRSNFENDQVNYSLSPMLQGSYKYFYNLDKRQIKGKNTAMNSGNFWGFTTKYRHKSFFGNTDDSGSIFIGPVWGIQRNYDSRFSLGLRLGYGILIAEENYATDVMINFRLGFVLASKP